MENQLTIDILGQPIAGTARAYLLFLTRIQTDARQSRLQDCQDLIFFVSEKLLGGETQMCQVTSVFFKLVGGVRL